MRMFAGDTGLLDHLLKNLADKVVTPEGDKLRRRHNAEGHMEYWLQSAEAAHAGEHPFIVHMRIAYSRIPW